MSTTSPRSFATIIDLIRRAKAKERGEELEPEDSDGEEHDDEDQPKKKRAKPKGKDEEPAEEDEEPGPARGGVLTPAQATDLAARIVAAGAARRGEAPITNPPPMISEAARHAGTSTYTTPVKDPAAVAAAIIAAGKKARTPT